MQTVPYSLIAIIARDYGAVDCCWRESEVSFTGFVAEVWFNELPGEFACKWAAVVGYPIKVRARAGLGRYVVSVPCGVERL